MYIPKCCIIIISFYIMQNTAHFCFKCISQSAVARIVAAMVISHLDYCSSVFIGLPADQIALLQRVQNNTARLMMKKKMRRSRNTASQATSLVTSKIPLSVQDCNSFLPPFQRVFTSSSFFISLHIQTVSLSPIF